MKWPKYETIQRGDWGGARRGGEVVQVKFSALGEVKSVIYVQWLNKELQDGSPLWGLFMHAFVHIISIFGY